MRTTIATPLVLAAVIGPALALGQHAQSTVATEETSAVANRAQMLLSADKSVRDGARQDILDAHNKLIARLSENIANHANHRDSQEGVAESIRLLGELRSPKAIDVLVEHIGFPLVSYPDRTYISPFPFRPGRPLQDYLPAMDALVNIGPASVLPVARKLVATESDLEYQACCDVLYSLRGGSMPVTVQEAMDWAYRTADPNRRLRLSRSRPLLGLPPVPEGFAAPPVPDGQ